MRVRACDRGSGVGAPLTTTSQVMRVRARALFFFFPPLFPVFMVICRVSAAPSGDVPHRTSRTMEVLARRLATKCVFQHLQLFQMC